MKKLATQILSFTVALLAVAHAQQFTVLYNFAGPPDGGVPEASMIYVGGMPSRVSAVPVGTLYGTTTVGGTGDCTMEGHITGCGTVFEVSGARETVLYSFQGGTDGWAPLGGLVRDKRGNLYGTAADGGAYGYGMVFKLAGKAKTILYSFQGTPDGAYPATTLTQDSEGNLYGTTDGGGANGVGGTVFKLDPSGNETVLYSFCSELECADGESPRGSLLMEASGDLFGTTYFGGNVGAGTVFKVDTKGIETVLHSFCTTPGDCPDGAYPEGGPAIDSTGNLYGTTTGGGVEGQPYGNVFKLDPSGQETVLHEFCSEPGCADGLQPIAGVIIDAQGNLFGTTGATVFEIDATGNFRIVYTFTGLPGPVEPVGGLTMDPKGNLYGTASQGGPGNCTFLYYGCGAVFKIKP
jgi:uncharacterized repeat protein (TIGR03803 family)